MAAIRKRDAGWWVGGGPKYDCNWGQVKKWYLGTRGREGTTWFKMEYKDKLESNFYI